MTKERIIVTASFYGEQVDKYTFRFQPKHLSPTKHCSELYGYPKTDSEMTRYVLSLESPFCNRPVCMASMTST